MNTNRTLVFGMAALAGLAVTSANGQIANSPHDFSTYTWSGGEICKPCHTPHFANYSAGKLWNHALTTSNCTMHDGTAGSATVDFDRVSRLCMSCHDGTVALDSFGGTDGTNYVPGAARVGTDLRDDHPIGREAIYPTTSSTRFNPQDATHTVTFGGHSLRLQSWVDTNGATQYVVGCSTCHNVHNKGNYGHLLQFSNASSAVCLTCHIK